jgi:hypothetical protein
VNVYNLVSAVGAVTLPAVLVGQTVPHGLADQLPVILWTVGAIGAVLLGYRRAIEEVESQVSKKLDLHTRDEELRFNAILEETRVIKLQVALIVEALNIHAVKHPSSPSVPKIQTP